MITKTERQAIGATKWSDNRGVGTCLYPMRFGKTIHGLRIAQKVLAKDDTRNVIIAVPSDIVRTTWNNAISVFVLNNTLDINRIRILTVNNISNLGHVASCTLLIVDEIHTFLSTEGRKIIDKTNVFYKFILGLTGTYPSGEGKEFLDKHCPVVDYIPKHVAIDNGWIATTIEYNIPLELPLMDANKYIRHSEPIADTLTLFKDKGKIIKYHGEVLFKDDYELIMGCYAGKAHKDAPDKYIKSSIVREALAKGLGWTPTLDLRVADNQDIEVLWNPSAIEETVKQFSAHVKSRNEIIINNQVKVDATIEVFKSNPVPTICFSESVEQADRICDSINKLYPGKATAYHTNIESKPLVDDNGNYRLTKAGTIKMFGKAKIKEDAIAGLANGKYLFLSTVRALDQGLDVPEIEQVIITAGTINPIQQSQRSARASTIDINNMEKIATIVNLYFDDIIDTDNNIIKCRDKTKLKARQIHNKNEVIWLTSLDTFKEAFNDK